MSSPTVAVPKKYSFLRQKTNSSQPWTQQTSGHNKHLILNNPFEFGQIIEEQTELFSGAILQKNGGLIKMQISLGFPSFIMNANTITKPMMKSIKRMINSNDDDFAKFFSTVSCNGYKKLKNSLNRSGCICIGMSHLN